MSQICLIIVALALASSVSAQMPMDFAVAMNNGGQKDVLNIKNYEIGASMTEAYTDIEKLSRDTEISTKSYGTNSVTDSAKEDTACQGCGSGGSLEASINSNVIGKAHIAWQSVDPIATIKGRHPLIGRSVEDLTGVFSIEKFIQLWAGSKPGEISVDWLPCS
jgi:hypothetical protein